jgi:hypothetical protein
MCTEETKDTIEAMASNAPDNKIDADIPVEYVDKVTDAIKAMQKAYIARSICAVNRKKNLVEKRRAAAKNAKKMRKMQRRHKK